jgi:hypothetical protein
MTHPHLWRGGQGVRYLKRLFYEVLSARGKSAYGRKLVSVIENSIQ